MSVRNVFVGVSALVLALSFGCKKDGKKDEGAEKPGGQAAPVPVAVPAETPALVGHSALERIPGTAPTLGATDGLQPWLERLGYSKLREKHGDAFAKAGAMSTSMVGVDLTDLSKWSEIGLDPKGSTGGALLSLKDEAVVVWATVSDGAKLEKTLLEVAKKNGVELTATDAGGGRLIRSPKGADPHGGVLIDGRIAYLAVGDGDADKNPIDIVLGVDKASSMAASKRLDGAMKTLSFGSQMAMYVDFGGMMKTIMGDGGMGATEKAFVDVFGDELWLAGGMGIEGKTLAMKLIYGLSKSSKVASLLSTRPNPVRLVAATEKQPLYLFSMSLEVAEKMLGTTIDDLVGTFTGEFGFVVTGELKRDLDEKALKDALGGHVLVGISGRENVDKLVNMAMTMGPVKELVKRDGDTFVIPTPGYKDVYVTITKDWITASTDKGFAKRAQAGAKGFAAGLGDSKLKELLTTGKTAGIGLVDYSAFGWLVWAGMANWDFPVDEESAERKALRAEIRKREKALEEKRMGAFMTFIEKIGLAGGSFYPDGSNMVAVGGLYMKATPAELLDEGIELAIRADTEWDKEEAEIQKLREKMWDLPAEVKTAPAVAPAPK